jgi:hypothetical protein
MVIDWETNAGEGDGEGMNIWKDGMSEVQISFNIFLLQLDFLKEREIDGKSN